MNFRKRIISRLNKKAKGPYSFKQEEQMAGEDYSNNESLYGNECPICSKINPHTPLESDFCSHKRCIECNKIFDKSDINADGYCAQCWGDGI